MEKTKYWGMEHAYLLLNKETETKQEFGFTSRIGEANSSITNFEQKRKQMGGEKRRN